MKIMILLCLIIILLILFFLYPPFVKTSAYRGKISDHFDGNIFYNAQSALPKKSFSIFKWWFLRDRPVWPKYVKNLTPMPITPALQNEIKVTFVNHATVLIQTANYNILTDPIWSERASPVSWFGPKRVREPGIPFSQLPTIDLVLISHNHYDHLDIPTIKRLQQKFNPLFIVPLGNKQLLMKYGVDKVIELDWWQQYTKDDMTITFLPTQHWSARWLTDKFKTLWGSYGIAINQSNIYFAGDAGYSPDFELIRKQWGEPDLAFIPIGAYLPRWIMEKHHLNPNEAVKAHLDLKAKKSFAIHYGTFQLSDEYYEQAVDDLTKALQNHAITQDQFGLLPEGHTYKVHEK